VRRPDAGDVEAAAAEASKRTRRFRDVVVEMED